MAAPSNQYWNNSKTWAALSSTGTGGSYNPSTGLITFSSNTAPLTWTAVGAGLNGAGGVTAASPTPNYASDLDWIYLEGAVNITSNLAGGTVGAPGGLVLTLPAGNRPSTTRFCGCSSLTSGNLLQFNWFVLAADGTMKIVNGPLNAGDTLYLDGLFFAKN